MTAGKSLNVHARPSVSPASTSRSRRKKYQASTYAKAMTSEI